MAKFSRKVILYIAASLDGYIAREDGSIDWLSLVESKGQDYGYTAFYKTVDTILIGRKTYEQAITLGQNPPFPGKVCYVFSSRPSKEKPEEETIFTNEPVEDVVEKIRKQDGGNVWLVGGAQLIHTCMGKRVIDEYIISFIPILLGSGIPLFQPHDIEQKLKLQTSINFPSGLVQMKYSVS